MDLPKPDDAGGSVELATLTEQGDTLEPIPLTFIEGWAAGTSAKIFSGLDDLLNEDRAPGVPARRLLVIKSGSRMRGEREACPLTSLQVRCLFVTVGSSSRGILCSQRWSL